MEKEQETGGARRLFIYVAIIAAAAFFILRSCGGFGGGNNDVTSLYGTYTGNDSYGNTICITLKDESENEWKKYGEDHSSNLCWTDSKGKIHHGDWQSITWDWDFSKGYVQTYYNGNKRTIIDFKNKKFYDSYGDYIDGRDGVPYSFKK